MKNSPSKHISHLCMLLKFHNLAVLARLVWGNQETIWPLSWAAKSAQPSERVLELCRPKKDFTRYQYRSVTW